MKLDKYVTQILYSAERAANLTNSLLAFSRKHIINLKDVSLNEIIGRAEKLLSRLVREDIELRVLTGPELLYPRRLHADRTGIDESGHQCPRLHARRRTAHNQHGADHAE